MMLLKKEVAKEIADETTLNPKEAEIALDQLQKVLIRNLLAGNSVQLGRVITLSSFWR
jgi:nucleoid DNA-binding protein